MSQTEIADSLRKYLDTPELVAGWITPQAVMLNDGTLAYTKYFKTPGGGLILRDALDVENGEYHPESPLGLVGRFERGERFVPPTLAIEAAPDVEQNQDKPVPGCYEADSSGQSLKDTQRWFHGIVGLTKTGTGYVQWKGRTIEHYSFHDPLNEERAALKLAKRCLGYEAKGFPVTGRTAAMPDIFEPAPAGTPWLNLLMHYYTFLSGADGKPAWCILALPDHHAVAVRVSNGALETRYGYETDGAFGTYNLYHEMQNEGYASCCERTQKYEDLVDVLKEIGITPQQYDSVIAAGVPERELDQTTPSTH